MIHVIASIEIRKENLTDFIEIFEANVPNVLAEKGCIEYAPTVDIETGFPTQVIEANMVTIVEKWDSLEALKAHLATPHMKDYRRKVKDMVADLSLKVLQNA